MESGKVTLRGNVDSHVQKLAAARLAARVKGVIDVNSSELVVNDTTTRPDGEIKNDVQRRLAINPTLDASRLTIEVDSGNVKLSGKVDSLAERSQIEIQSWLTGVKSVDAKEMRLTLRDCRVVAKPSSIKFVAICGLRKRPKMHCCLTHV